MARTRRRPNRAVQMPPATIGSAGRPASVARASQPPLAAEATPAVALIVVRATTPPRFPAPDALEIRRVTTDRPLDGSKRHGRGDHPRETRCRCDGRRRVAAAVRLPCEPARIARTAHAVAYRRVV